MAVCFITSLGRMCACEFWYDIWRNSVPPHVPEDLALWSRLPILNEILEWDGRVAFLKHPNLENDGDVFENEGVIKYGLLKMQRRISGRVRL